MGVDVDCHSLGDLGMRSCIRVHRCLREGGILDRQSLAEERVAVSINTETMSVAFMVLVSAMESVEIMGMV